MKSVICKYHPLDPPLKLRGGSKGGDIEELIVQVFRVLFKEYNAGLYMKSELLREHVYVLCLSCAVAQEVTSIPKALGLMKGHETVLPSHHRFIKSRPSGTKLFWNNGPKLNEIAEAEVNDLRLVKIGYLEVR